MKNQRLLKIPVFLSVCDEVEGFTLGGKPYKAGARAKKISVTANALARDKVEFRFGDLGLEWSPQVGSASKIRAASVRVCKDKITLIADYKDPKLNAAGCCACCTRNGTTTCVYGSSGCVCC